MKPKPSLQRRFILAESNSLVIETIQTYDRDCPRGGLYAQAGQGTLPGQRLRILKLKGTWRANNYNELVFEVTGHKGKRETYVFKGSWKVNSNQQIEYTFEDSRDTLTFKGFWKINSANRLVYVFEGSSTSRFEFKVQLESANIYPKKGEIRYRIGIGLRKSRLTAPGNLLILYGEWKLSRNLELTFQMNYGKGRISAIEFGATLTFGRNKVILALKDEFGKPLGITLTLSHEFLKIRDAQVFLRLKSLQREQAIEAGITIPF